MKKKQSLRVKLVIFCAVSVSVLCAGFVFTTLLQMRKTFFHQASSELADARTLSSGKISFILRQIYMETHDLMQTQVLAHLESGQSSAVTEGEIKKAMQYVLKKDPLLKTFWVEFDQSVIEKSGMSLSQKLQDQNGGNRYAIHLKLNGDAFVDALQSEPVPGLSQYYTAAKESKGLKLFTHMAEANGGEQLSLLFPLLLNNQVVGAAGAVVDVKEVVAKVGKTTGFDGEVQYALLDQNLSLVLSSLSLSSFKTQGFLDYFKGSSFSQLLNSSETLEGGKSQVMQEFSNWYLQWEKLEGGEFNLNPLYLVSFVNRDKVYGPLFQLLGLQVIGSLFTAALILFAAYFFIKKISDRLAFSAGKLDSLSQETLHNSQKVKESSEKVNSGSTSNASAIHQTVASLDEIKAMVEQNVDNAKRSEEAVVEGTKLAEAGSRDIKNMMVSMQEIESTSNQMFTQFKHNSDELNSIVNMIEQISEKAKVINDIVFQTKLLSFNASVEAARAGEMGKGFAVVAEEVGNLAQMSGNAAKEIEELLQKSSNEVRRIVQSSVESIESMVGETSQKIKSGLNTAEQCQGSLESIVQTVEQLRGMITQISTASSEQFSGIQNISQAMNQISTTSEENRVASDETLKCSGLMAQEADALKACADEINWEVLGSSSLSQGFSKPSGSFLGEKSSALAGLGGLFKKQTSTDSFNSSFEKKQNSKFEANRSALNKSAHAPLAKKISSKGADQSNVISFAAKKSILTSHKPSKAGSVLSNLTQSISTGGGLSKGSDKASLGMASSTSSPLTGAATHAKKDASLEAGSKPFAGPPKKGPKPPEFIKDVSAGSLLPSANDPRFEDV